MKAFEICFSDSSEIANTQTHTHTHSSLEDYRKELFLLCAAREKTEILLYHIMVRERDLKKKGKSLSLISADVADELATSSDTILNYFCRLPRKALGCLISDYIIYSFLSHEKKFITSLNLLV